MTWLHIALAGGKGDADALAAAENGVAGGGMGGNGDTGGRSGDHGKSVKRLDPLVRRK